MTKISKIFILPFLLFSTSTMADDFQDAAKLMSGIRNCIPTSTKFCNGMTLSSDQVDELISMDVTACRNRISQFGYKIVDSDIKDREYLEFKASTKNAEVIHNKKMAFFKHPDNHVDCVHELLHIYQRNYCQGDLCPLERDKRAARMLKSLNRSADKVGQLEKQKKIVEAQKIAKLVEMQIAVYKEWLNLINSVDELDVHSFIYRNCEKLKCQTGDRETALANIFKLKNYVNPRLLPQVFAAVKDVVEDKTAAIREELAPQYKKLSARRLQVFKKALLADLFNNLSRDNIDAYRLMLPIKENNPKLRDFSKKGLPVMGSGHPLFSKLNTVSFDGSSFVCDKNKKVLVVGNKFKYEYALRDYFILLKSFEDESICEFDTLERFYKNQFSAGKMSREDFERRILEIKVKKILIMDELLEVLSDNLVYKDYRLDLLKFRSDKDSDRFFPRLGKVKMSYKNLYRIDVDSIPYVFDTGAMNSIASKRFFTDERVNHSIWIKDIAMKNVLGDVVYTPYIQFLGTVDVGGLIVNDLRLSPRGIKIKNIDGILGLDFFNQQDFKIDLEKMEISFVNGNDIDYDEEEMHPLVSDLDGIYRSLEFKCEDGAVARLDTGSEVYGDILKSQQKINCRGLTLDRSKMIESSSSLMFSRGTVVNLGVKWLQQFKEVYVLFSKGGIIFR